MDDLITDTIWMPVTSVIEIAVFIFGLYCSSIIYRRYLGDQKKERLYLLFFFSVLTIFPLFQLMDGLCYPHLYSMKYGYSINILVSALANISLLIFTLEVFLPEKKEKSTGIKLYFYLFILGVLLLGIIAFFLKLADKDVTLFLGGLFLIAMTNFLLITFNSFRLQRKITDKKDKAAVKYIGLFALVFFGVYIFFILDSFYDVYTLWGSLGWGFYLISILVGYKGFFSPMRKRIKQEESALPPDRSLSHRYLIFLLIYLSLYEIFDSYTTSFYPTVVSFITADFGVTMDRYYLSLSIASIGLYLVIFILYLCDLIGRKPMIIIVFFGMGFGSLILSISETMSTFTLGLFLLFVFFSSDVWVIILSEEAPKEKRARYTSIVSLVGILGVFIIPIFRTLLIDASEPHTWTRMSMFGTIGILLAFIGFFLYETKAFRQLKEQGELKEKWSKESITQILKGPFTAENYKQMLSFILISFALGINYVTFNTVEQFLTDSFQDQNLVTLFITAAAIGSVLSFPTVGFLADAFGRRTILPIYALLCFSGIGCLIWATNGTIVAFVFIGIIIAQFGYWGMFLLVKLYCAECFDTNIRGATAGWRAFAYAFGFTIGALLSSYFARTMSLGVTFFINSFWIILLVPALTYAYLPETKGIDLMPESH